MMKRHYTAQELIKMPTNEFRMLKVCLAVKAFQLLGIQYKTYVQITDDGFGGFIITSDWDKP